MKQAVVIIHGIGEQRPMSTLRGFVESLLNYERFVHGSADEKRNFWIKPDRINNSYELRKISAAGRPGIRSGTHFYEYHWAANMRDTNWKHIKSWAVSLFFRDPIGTRLLGKFGAHHRMILLWIFLVTAFGTWVWWLSQVMIPVVQGTSDFYSFETFCKAQWLLLPILLIWFLPKIFLGYIGDAARYLKGDAHNIAEREVIRKNGVDLLKALHKTGDYDRIILVGHSLGSVIAYDIITYLWIDFNKSIVLNQKEKEIENGNETWGPSFGNITVDDPHMNRLIAISIEMAENLKVVQKNKSHIIELEQLRDEFRQVQRQFWIKVKNDRKGWLISDLVTLGSPLAHGNLLMADKDEEFQRRIDEREFPACPPVLDGKDYTYGGNSEGQKYIHHATPFSVVRWSNIFYPGDFIAGRVSKTFGFAVSDKRVFYHTSWKFLKPFYYLISRLSVLTHTHYWKADTKAKKIMNIKEWEAIKETYKALELDDIKRDLYKLNDISS